MTSAWCHMVKGSPCFEGGHRYYIRVCNTIVVKPKVFIFIVDKRHEVFRIGPIVQLIQTFKNVEVDSTRTIIIVLLILILVSGNKNYGNINDCVGNLHDFPDMYIARQISGEVGLMSKSNKPCEFLIHVFTRTYKLQIKGQDRI
jgi:hypothetical protein